jgi:hypothetical protein
MQLRPPPSRQAFASFLCLAASFSELAQSRLLKSESLWKSCDTYFARRVCAQNDERRTAVRVRFLGFYCEEESDWDQSTGSDEPYFIIGVVGTINEYNLELPQHFSRDHVCG